MNSPDELAFQKRWQRIESLVETLERIADPEVRAAARELVQSLLELHQGGLARMLAVAGQHESAALLEAWTCDDLVRSLLVLYGLHPVELEQRVTDALERLRPRLLVRGADAELLSVADDVVRLRIEEKPAGYTVPIEDLCRFIEAALGEEVPDVAAIEFEKPATLRVPLPLIGPLQ